MLSQLDLNQKIFKFETFCKRGDPVWQEGRTRDHGWFIPNMVSDFFWIILEKFGQCVRCARSIESEPVGLRWKIHSSGSLAPVSVKTVRLQRCQDTQKNRVN